MRKGQTPVFPRAKGQTPVSLDDLLNRRTRLRPGLPLPLRIKVETTEVFAHNIICYNLWIIILNRYFNMHRFRWRTAGWRSTGMRRQCLEEGMRRIFSTPPGRPARARAQDAQSPRARGGAGRFRWMGRLDASGKAAGAGRCGRRPSAMRRIRPPRRGIDAHVGPAAARGRRGRSERPAGRAASGLGARKTGESDGRRPREVIFERRSRVGEEPVAGVDPRGRGDAKRARAAVFRRDPFPARVEQEAGLRRATEKSHGPRTGTRKRFRPVFAGVSAQSGAPAPEKSGISVRRESAERLPH